MFNAQFSVCLHYTKIRNVKKQISKGKGDYVSNWNKTPAQKKTLYKIQGPLL